MVLQPQKAMSAPDLRLSYRCLYRKSENGVKNESTPDAETFTFRLMPDLRKELELIAEYEGELSLSELVRSCLHERVDKRRKDRQYQKWVEKRGQIRLDRGP